MPFRDKSTDCDEPPFSLCRAVALPFISVIPSVRHRKSNGPAQRRKREKEREKKRAICGREKERTGWRYSVELISSVAHLEYDDADEKKKEEEEEEKKNPKTNK